MNEHHMKLMERKYAGLRDEKVSLLARIRENVKETEKTKKAIIDATEGLKFNRVLGFWVRK